MIERFWSKVDKSGECWLWKASVNKGGYGRFMTRKPHFATAHRLAWFLCRGDIPENLCVLHKCDTPRCVNPDHLFLGTRAENVQDMDAKKRRVPARGERNSHAKLSVNDVAEIRRLYEKRILMPTALGKKYGVDRTHIHHIVRGDVWRTAA